VSSFTFLSAWSEIPAGLALLSVVSTLGCHIMGSEDEAEQSVERAGADLLRRYTQSDELTSPIVPGGDLDAGAAPVLLWLTIRQQDLHSSETPSRQSTFDAG
jgi:hypothetical protein